MAKRAPKFTNSDYFDEAKQQKFIDDYCSLGRNNMLSSKEYCDAAIKRFLSMPNIKDEIEKRKAEEASYRKEKSMEPAVKKDKVEEKEPYTLIKLGELMDWISERSANIAELTDRIVRNQYEQNNLLMVVDQTAKDNDQRFVEKIYTHLVNSIMKINYDIMVTRQCDYLKLCIKRMRGITELWCPDMNEYPSMQEYINLGFIDISGVLENKLKETVVWAFDNSKMDLGKPYFMVIVDGVAKVFNSGGDARMFELKSFRAGCKSCKNYRLEFKLYEDTNCVGFDLKEDEL